jgi:hypothetical protein
MEMSPVIAVSRMGIWIAMIQVRLLPLAMGSRLQLWPAFLWEAHLAGFEIRACLFPGLARLVMRLVLVMGLVLELEQAGFAPGFVVGFDEYSGHPLAGLLVETRG